MNACIGITTSFEDDTQSLRRDYVQAVERAGALPLIAPMVESEDALRAFADRIDGLIITGGPAITEGLIGSLPEDLSTIDAVRSDADRRLLEMVMADRKPILGICYGMQLLSARAGGTIYADVERQMDDALVHSQKRGATTHPMRIEPDTHLYRLLDAPEIDVNTRHLQAIAEVGEGFRVAGTAPDGAIEAIETPDGMILGVQFHPERMGDVMQPLFRHLVAQAQRTATPTGSPSIPARKD